MKYPQEINEWLSRLAEIENAKKVAEQAFKDAAKILPPKNLRQAEAKDIFEGSLIWLPSHVDDPEFEEQDDWPFPCWHIVEEVLHPSDEWKAYCFNGCRYGLNGAFVEDD